MQDDEQVPTKCKCVICGEVFINGSEGDNEEYHLRCEREEEISNKEENIYE